MLKYGEFQLAGWQGRGKESSCSSVLCRGQGRNACMIPAAASRALLPQVENRAMGIGDKTSLQKYFMASVTVPNDTEYLPSVNETLLPEIKQEHLLSARKAYDNVCNTFS